MTASAVASFALITEPLTHAVCDLFFCFFNDGLTGLSAIPSFAHAVEVA
jgi:hypothetical protein